MAVRISSSVSPACSRLRTSARKSCANGASLSSIDWFWQTKQRSSSDKARARFSKAASSSASPGLSAKAVGAVNIQARQITALICDRLVGNARRPIMPPAFACRYARPRQSIRPAPSAHRPAISARQADDTKSAKRAYHPPARQSLHINDRPAFCNCRFRGLAALGLVKPPFGK